MSSKTKGGMMLKCEACKNMDWELMYCNFIKHEIENSYAMVCHSRFCGDGFEPRIEKTTNAINKEMND